MIRVRLPDGVRDAQLTPPGGVAQPMTVRDGEASWGPARRAGAYRVSWTGAAGAAGARWIAELGAGNRYVLDVWAGS